MNTFMAMTISVIAASSDSSMVDNTAGLDIWFCLFLFRFLYGRWIRKTVPQVKSVVRSIPLWSMNTIREPYLLGNLCVQIPLWSMNTLFARLIFLLKYCSDSMVDEYTFLRPNLILLDMFRFLYGRWILQGHYPSSMSRSRSDSSMVDEYSGKLRE